MSDGMRNGNMLTPAVAMIPKMPTALPMNASPLRCALVKSSASNGPRKPRTGAAIIQ